MYKSTLLIGLMSFCWVPLSVAQQRPTASFNCDVAQTSIEHLICKTSALSAVDSELGNLYKIKKALLSNEGQLLLAKSQRSWLRYMHTICAETSKSDISPEICLQREYKTRISQLHDVGVQFGPYSLNRIDDYQLKPSDDESGTAPGFYLQHIAYPQIDYTTKESEKQWNRNHAITIPDIKNDVSESDYDIGYSISFVNSHILSLNKHRYSYGHGAAHGNSHVNAEAVVLPEFRSLATSDLFGHNADALSVIQAMFLEAYSEQGWPGEGWPKDTYESMQKEASKIVINPTRWVLTKEGLTVPFSPYEISCYVCSPPNVTIPWPKLKPLLAPGSLAP